MSAPTSFTYQWKSAASNATGPGATTANYTVVSADAGNAMTCVVTGINSAGSSPVTTLATNAVGSSGNAPLIVPAVGGSGAALRTVGSSTRLKLKGVCVWGMNDTVTQNGNTGANNLADRTAICNAIASNGGNIIRLRVLGYEYTNQQFQTSAEYLTAIVNWRNAASAAGLYTMLCNWDSSDSPSMGNGNWPSGYSSAFSFYTAAYNALKINGADDPRVLWEPWNEPGGSDTTSTWAQWQVAMQATVHLFRSDGYQGVIVLDTPEWSHDYDDGNMSTIEAYDATQTSSGHHNLMFARHDYWDDYGGNWSYGAWEGATGGTATAHVIFDTEFGNYNNGAQNTGFSGAETAGFVTNMFSRTNIAGGVAFVWNWVDPNSITNLPASFTNPWGNDVQNWLQNAQ